MPGLLPLALGAESSIGTSLRRTGRNTGRSPARDGARGAGAAEAAGLLPS
jgi:hypothetical protein